MGKHLSGLIRFGLLGAVGAVLNIAVTVGLTEGVGAPEEMAFAVALVVVFFFSFLTSRYLIFAGASAGDPGDSSSDSRSPRRSFGLPSTSAFSCCTRSWGCRT